jgi:hypothetical protein
MSLYAIGTSRGENVYAQDFKTTRKHRGKIQQGEEDQKTKAKAVKMRDSKQEENIDVKGVLQEDLADG